MRKITTILFFVLSFSLVGCNLPGSTSSPGEDSVSQSVSERDSTPIEGEEERTYTVTWKNYDGSVLEIDTDVAKGSIPTYDGATPTRASNGELSYEFRGWTPTLSAVVQDVVYTAAFTSVYNGQSVVGMQPTLTDSGSILYGLYPQTCVREESLIAALDALSPSEINGWYLYEGEYYAKETANVYNGEEYTFDGGSAIVNGSAYWFKCQPIEWEILREGEGEYYLVSTLLLDAGAYYSSYERRTIGGEIVYANNYAESDLRVWLNDEFFTTAFLLNSACLLKTTVENGGETTDFVGNSYASKNTEDYVFLPSYQDYINASYGFANSPEKSTSREAKTTDYARATGAWCHTRNNAEEKTQHNGSYWTRSASGEYDYCATVVNAGGYLSTYAVDVASHSIRPAILLGKDGL